MEEDLDEILSKLGRYILYPAQKETKAEVISDLQQLIDREVLKARNSGMVSAFEDAIYMSEKAIEDRLAELKSQGIE